MALSGPGLALAAMLALVSGQDTLLPETPDGWRSERLDFPLAFAPDLGHEGYEELRFAPGMFDAASDSYFSYVLAIELEGDVALDRAAVESFLLKYYHGLCRAVGESRQLDIDLSKIAVAVERAGSGPAAYHATIEMYDTFVTGKPMTLRLELDVHVTPDATQLFGAASPLPKDAAIWTELRTIARRWRDARPPPVFLNHVFVIPDDATYRAIAASEFLREQLAVSEERTTKRDDMSYTGVYFYGDRTYFELLPPGVMPEGASGVAFGIERAGFTDLVARELMKARIRTYRGPRTREIDGTVRPWFKIMGVQIPHEGSQLALFSMEYDRAFLDDGGITRREVLAQYARTLGREPAPFRDVTEVHLVLHRAERERLVETCRVFGYDVKQSENRSIVRGPQYKLVVTDADASRGIVELHLSLRKPIDRDPMELGRARLRFEGDTAVMSFP